MSVAVLCLVVGCGKKDSTVSAKQHHTNIAPILPPTFASITITNKDKPIWLKPSSNDFEYVSSERVSVSVHVLRPIVEHERYYEFYMAATNLELICSKQPIVSTNEFGKWIIHFKE